MTTDLAAEAQGWLDGDKRHIAIQLGTATLELTYDSSAEEGAQAGGILMMMAQQLLAEVDQVFDEGGAEEDGLAQDDKKFLLNQLIKDDSDFDDNDEVMGWVNYDTRETDDFGRPVVKVTFESGDDDEPRVTLTGRWALTYLGGEEETVTNDLPEEAEGNR